MILKGAQSQRLLAGRHTLLAFKARHASCLPGSGLPLRGCIGICGGVAQQPVIGGGPHGPLQRSEKRQSPQVVLRRHGIVDNGQQYEPQVSLRQYETMYAQVCYSTLGGGAN